MGVQGEMVRGKEESVLRKGMDTRTQICALKANFRKEDLAIIDRAKIGKGKEHGI